MFHRQATGEESVNLDTFMMTEEQVKSQYSKYTQNADAAIIEGAMGLFDGYERSRGSSAEIAMLLDVGVILLVNAKSTAYSVAATLQGFSTFCKGLRIAGVVFNMVGSDRHYNMLRVACTDVGVRCLGYIPRNQELTIPSRHLGLTTLEQERLERLIDTSAGEIESHVDLSALFPESL